MVADAFEEACKKAEVINKGFYTIRRTAIDLIDKIAGKEIADLFSLHAPKGMTKKHYTNRRWRELFRALRKLRRKLQPTFDAASVGDGHPDFVGE